MDANVQIGIEDQCLQLLRSFSYYEDFMDQPGNIDRVVALFTPDGSIKSPVDDAPGADGIRKWATGIAARHTPASTSRHVVGGAHFAEVSPDHVQAVVYDFTYLVHIAPDQTMTYATPQPFLMTQTVDFRQTPQGWRIDRLHVDSVVQPIGATGPPVMPPVK